MAKSRESQVDWLSLIELNPLHTSGLAWTVARLLGDGDKETIVGSEAGAFCTTNRYYKIGHLGERFQCHRVVWYLNNGDIPSGMVVDHIDGNTSNNKIDNLRIVSTSVNSRNRNMQADNTSGKTGVYLNVKSWKQSKIPYWMASWTDIDGTQRTKCFRISEHGDAEAFRLAAEYRDKVIQEMVKLGMDYSDRHGRDKCI
jgi:hypothetical protein